MADIDILAAWLVWMSVLAPWPHSLIATWQMDHDDLCLDEAQLG
jgi:hypothetical protein